MKIYKDQNVFEAARERVAFVFDEFDEVIVASSSGKDSTVIMELAIMEAELRGRLPVKVLFVDQEAEWSSTVQYMEHLAARPEIDLWWIQIPFRMDNAASFYQDEIHAWGPGEEWMRPQFPGAKVDPEPFGDYRNKKQPLNDFYHMFPNCYAAAAGHRRFGVLYGMRVEESPVRRLNLTKVKGGYKGRGWAVNVSEKTDSWRLAPIWDWRVDDVWAAIYKYGWEYNRVYDLMYQYGVPVRKMRVSSLIHGVAAHNDLKMLQELDLGTYEALVKRLPGINTYSHLQEGMLIQRLPSAFATWEEYQAHLFDHLLGDNARAQFEALFKSKLAARIPDGEEKFRLFATLIVGNDYLGVGMVNYVNNPSKHARG